MRLLSFRKLTRSNNLTSAATEQETNVKRRNSSSSLVGSGNNNSFDGAPNVSVAATIAKNHNSSTSPVPATAAATITAPPRRRHSSSAAYNRKSPRRSFTSKMLPGGKVEAVQSSTSRQSSKKTLLDKIGGETALEIFCEIFCERVAADEQLMKFFQGVNLERFKAHQYKFMALALQQDHEVQKLQQGGGSGTGNHHFSKYRQQMMDNHSKFFDLGLNETHFDQIILRFTETCQELDIEDKYINEVYTKILLPYRVIFIQT